MKKVTDDTLKEYFNYPEKQQNNKEEHLYKSFTNLTKTKTKQGSPVNSRVGL